MSPDTTEHAGAAAAVQEWRPRHNPWLIALTVSMATFMEVLDTSIANVALPHIAGNLSASTDEATWILTSYLVSNAIVLPLSAWISRAVGRKRFYMTCVALFTISSALCGMAPTLGALIVLRVLQGAGGGGLQPSEQAILADTFVPSQRGMAFAVYGIAVVSAPALGPTLGGWITDNYSWRWIFYINVPVGVLSLLMTNHFVEDRPYERGRGFAAQGKIDYLGLGLIALGLGCLQVVLDKGQEDDWFGSNFITTLSVLAAIGLIGALIWEWRHKNPIVNLRLFMQRNFATAFALMFMLGVVLLGSTVLIPIFLQTLMGYTAKDSGLALTWGALAIMALMPVVGPLTTRVQAKWLIAIGLVVGAYGLHRMTGWDLQVDFWTVAGDRVIQAAGFAFLFAPINTAAYLGVPMEQNNQVSSLLNVARNIGGSIGISTVTTLTARRAQWHQNVLVGHLTPFDDTYSNALTSLRHTLLPAGSSNVAATGRALGVISRAVVQQATALATLDAFRLLSMLFLAALPLLLLLKRYNPRALAHAAH
jgi:DHA2 family multidrug resistance protein